MLLPEGKIKGESINPTKLVIYSKPKAGKTTLISELEDCLLVDFEKGSGFVDAMKVEVNNLKDLAELIKSLKQRKDQGKIYKRIALDTATQLEEISKELALKMYKDTAIGKSYKEDDILKLPQGAGYYWVREAFFKILDMFSECTENLIILGHLKDKKLNDTGELVDSATIDLTGKIKSMICAKSDAIAYLFRRGNQTILNFKSNDEVTCGARPDHLRNQEIVAAELIDDKYVTYWDKIFV